MTKIVPTVGRVMLYVPVLGEGIPCIPGEKLAAIVAKVWEDEGLVNLMVIDANGVPERRLSVQVVQEGEEAPKGVGYATWMPYQVGQAAKTQELQRMVDEELGKTGNDQQQPAGMNKL